MMESFFRDEAHETSRESIPDLDNVKDDSSAKREAAAGAFKTEEGRLAAILSYIPFLCFIPLLNMKENKEASFHARQGVLLFMIELVAVLFLIDGISDFVFKGILIAAIALSIAGVYSALRGKSYKLPIIGDLAEKTKL
jgi:fumarate reductase subunit D